MDPTLPRRRTLSRFIRYINALVMRLQTHAATNAALVPVSRQRRLAISHQFFSSAFACRKLQLICGPSSQGHCDSHAGKCARDVIGMMWDNHRPLNALEIWQSVSAVQPAQDVYLAWLVHRMGC